MAVPYLNRSVAVLSPRRPGFNHRLVHVRFVGDKVAVGQVSRLVPRFTPVSIIPPVFHTSYYRREKWPKPGSVQTQNAFSDIGGALDRTHFSGCVEVIEGQALLSSDAKQFSRVAFYCGVFLPVVSVGVMKNFSQGLFTFDISTI
jgi:hypothetical protein